jgi:anti-sigma factor RsiW
MANDRTGEHWRELSWRRDLTPAEQAELRAWLSGHPEALAEWQAEAALNRALDQLPDAAVPSNFTARVLEAAAREPGVVSRRGPLRWLAWRGRLHWLPKAAFVAIFIGASLLSHHQVQAFQRAQLARSVVAIADVTSLPSPQILTNFEAIQVLDRTPPADIELLQLLK